MFHQRRHLTGLIHQPQQEDEEERNKEHVCVSAILSDLLFFSCLAAFYTGVGFAIASLLN
jgi:hypothetical protein